MTQESDSELSHILSGIESIKGTNRPGLREEDIKKAREGFEAYKTLSFEYAHIDRIFVSGKALLYIGEYKQSSRTRCAPPAPHILVYGIPRGSTILDSLLETIQEEMRMAFQHKTVPVDFGVAAVEDYAGLCERLDALGFTCRTIKVGKRLSRMLDGATLSLKDATADTKWLKILYDSLRRVLR